MAYGGLVGQSSAEAENVGYNNKNTSTIIKSDNVQGAIDQLFTSVSEGKSLVTKAVTDKGVQTALDATFETIAKNVGKIEAVNQYLKDNTPIVKVYVPYADNPYPSFSNKFENGEEVKWYQGSREISLSTNRGSSNNDYLHISYGTTYKNVATFYFQTKFAPVTNELRVTNVHVDNPGVDIVIDRNVIVDENGLTWYMDMTLSQDFYWDSNLTKQGTKRLVFNIGDSIEFFKLKEGTESSKSYNLYESGIGTGN